MSLPFSTVPLQRKLDDAPLSLTTIISRIPHTLVTLLCPSQRSSPRSPNALVTLLCPSQRSSQGSLIPWWPSSVPHNDHLQDPSYLGDPPLSLTKIISRIPHTLVTLLCPSQRSSPGSLIPWWPSTVPHKDHLQDPSYLGDPPLSLTKIISRIPHTLVTLLCPSQRSSPGSLTPWWPSSVPHKDHLQDPSYLGDPPLSLTEIISRIPHTLVTLLCPSQRSSPGSLIPWWPSSVPHKDHLQDPSYLGDPPLSLTKIISRIPHTLVTLLCPSQRSSPGSLIPWWPSSVPHRDHLQDPSYLGDPPLSLTKIISRIPHVLVTLLCPSQRSSPGSLTPWWPSSVPHKDHLQDPSYLGDPPLSLTEIISRIPHTLVTLLCPSQRSSPGSLIPWWPSSVPHRDHLQDPSCLGDPPLSLTKIISKIPHTLVTLLCPSQRSSPGSLIPWWPSSVPHRDHLQDPSYLGDPPLSLTKIISKIPHTLVTLPLSLTKIISRIPHTLVTLLCPSQRSSPGSLIPWWPSSVPHRDHLQDPSYLGDPPLSFTTIISRIPHTLVTLLCPSQRSSPGSLIPWWPSSVPHKDEISRPLPWWFPVSLHEAPFLSILSIPIHHFPHILWINTCQVKIFSSRLDLLNRCK